MFGIRRFLGDIRHFERYWIEPIFPISKLSSSMALYRRFLKSWHSYEKISQNGNLRFIDSFPCLFDDNDITTFDAHYFYQAVWATERIIKNKMEHHIDVGSDIKYVGLLTTHLPVTFVDIRPFHADLRKLFCTSGDLLHLPFKTNSIKSLSCLHVIEHVGLGRYGDEINPNGSTQAIAELIRVLDEGGNLFLSIPIGKPRVCFNAHRIFNPATILDYFNGLVLNEFSVVSDQHELLLNVRPEQFVNSYYACGLYWFHKPNSN